MKAAVLHDVGKPLTIEEVQVANPRSHEVLVRTAAVGVCHSDLHFIEGLYSVSMPVILGHESAGIVEKVGSEVRYVSPGDHVITCLSVFCGHCEFCTTGRPSADVQVGSTVAATLEIWSSNIGEHYEKALASGKVEEIGDLGLVPVETW